jgi:hypothetical protein
MPFAGVIHSIMDFGGSGPSRDSILGQVTMRVQGKFSFGILPEGTYQKFSFKQILQATRFLLVAFLTRQYIPSPFFNTQTRKPVVVPFTKGPNF